MRPVLVVAVLIATLAAGCSSNSEGRPGPGTGSSAVGSGTGQPPPPPPVDPRIARGGDTFQKYCALCHAKDGTGYAADHAPSMVNERLLRSADNAFLARSISLGRPNTPMAGYSRDLGGPLSDAQIDEIVVWMRHTGKVAKPDALPPAGKGDPVAGAALYTATCQRCHGDPGTRLEAIQLGHPTFLALASDAFLRYGIEHGRPGTPMEAFGAKLTAQQMDDLVAHLRSWATPYTPPVKHPPPVPATGPVVINEKGRGASFTLKDGRFVASAQVAAQLKAKRRMVIIDARPSSDWLAIRIPGSISVPHYDMAALDRVPKDDTTWVLAYCACPHHASGVIVDELRKRGYRNTAVIDEGILFWRQQGYPIEGSAANDPLPAPGADPHAGHVH